MTQWLIHARSGLLPTLCWLTVFVAPVVLAGCAQAQPELRAPIEQSPTQGMPDAWRELGARLKADNLYGADIDALLRRLDPPSPDPMGLKIRELYRVKFPPPPPPPPPPGTPPPPPPKRPPIYVYPKVVTPENAVDCRAFLAQHEAAFARAEARYRVPRSIAVALLFVETRLGRSPGKHNVLYTLASMAATRSPDQISVWLEKLDQPGAHMDWISETILKRSDWAYKELTAFLTYARANNIDLLSVPGSMYGAMGICQFMPSSILLFAADGNNDGVIDLFLIDDAIASLSSYLEMNGWKPGADRKAQHAALKRYNRLDIYANTILCLADLVRGEPMGKPVPLGGKKALGKKKPPLKSNAPAKKQPAAKTEGKPLPQKTVGKTS